ncbi:MAG: exonuclease [Bacteroidales bacterium]|nr:exonuclease [Bacteroidales bacterium]MBP5134745.1 3'-5' exonuclease [Paludibacteraceae bacterium]MDD6356790.1 3'-5' exonuclease [Bacteroidales bacterium]
MKNFVAIDFETANGRRSSVCSVGIVVVKGGEIVDSFYSLIKPTPNYYAIFCQEVHGLSAADTDSAPLFPEVWRRAMAQVSRTFPCFADSGVPFVAHNKAFDESCLRAVFQSYQMDYPEYTFLCTCIASRRHFGRTIPNHQLHTVSAACGYILQNHHHALADAEACAWIAREIL